MISGFLIGDKELIAKLRAFPEKAREDIDRTTVALGYGLEALVKSQYLTGQVFKVQTGRLRSSISHGGPDTRSHFEATPTSSTYYVGTNVSYARPLFYGHNGYDIVPKTKKALKFNVGGATVFAKRVHMPAKAGKNVLEMALKQYAPTIIAQYKASLIRTAQAVFHS
jgi:hypothetical protein